MTNKLGSRPSKDAFNLTASNGTPTCTIFTNLSYSKGVWTGSSTTVWVFCTVLTDCSCLSTVSIFSVLSDGTSCDFASVGCDSVGDALLISGIEESYKIIVLLHDIKNRKGIFRKGIPLAVPSRKWWFL